jgi:cell division protein FtsL
MESFEYAIKKDVRNNPIVREVDEAREREQWKWLGMGSVLVLVMLFSAWQHWSLRQQGYHIEDIQKALAVEESEGQRLLLQIETLRAPERIEQQARDTLGMIQPAIGDAIVIERVQPADTPAPSVVARR